MNKGQKMPLKLKQRMRESLIKKMKHRTKPFVQLSKNGEIITYWNSLGELKRLLCIKPYYVQRVLHGQFKTFKGYRWEYIR